MYIYVYIFIGEERSIAEECSLENEDYLGIFTNMCIIYTILHLPPHIYIYIYTYRYLCMYL
jgi:hypothetical protein